jgi:hypothetical protein
MMNDVTTEPDTETGRKADTETAGPSVDAEQVRLLRCGRTLPPVHHLLEDARVLGRRRWGPSYTALCGAELSGTDSGEDDGDECPGCRDCLRYCARCTAEATRFAEHQAGGGHPDSSSST